MSRLNDPVEAMKIKPNQAKVVPPPPVVRPPTPEHLAAEAAAKAAPPPPPRQFLRVVKGGRVSLDGQITLIPEGDLLDAASYSPVYVQRMRDAGIVLELVV